MVPNAHLSISKVLGVEFHCVSSGHWDDPNLVPIPVSDGSESVPARNVATGGSQTSASGSALLAHPCDGMKRYLETGCFYYSTSGDWDLSKRLSTWSWTDWTAGSAGSALDNFDERFGAFLVSVLSSVL